MICFLTVNKFCKDDISLIENYNQAANDKTQTWDCHHRLETDLGLSANELKERNRYFNVPASELIFLTHSEHQKLHKIDFKPSEETRANMSIAQKKRFEKEPPWNKGKKGVQKPWNKGVPPSEESREKNRQAHLGKTPWNKGKKGTQQAWNKGMTKEEMKNYKKK